MADQGGVVDELVVKLSLDPTPYQNEHKIIVQLVDKTEKKLVDNDKKAKKRDVEQKKRTQESTKAVKQLTEALGKMAFTVGAVLGIGGGAAGITGAILALTGMETGLRKAAVSTGMSNRELQAWGATARRLGTDAQSGAASIAALAREQQQFALTGNGPTMSAFSRMGINVGPNVSIQDMLEQAQKIYHQANPAQQKQYEAQLSASGVSDDLIVMIKSEKDARAAYTQSYAESATENRKALDAVTDAMSAVENAAINVANSLATLLGPSIQQFANWATQGAQGLSAFADKVIAAGGGVDGFMDVLRQDNPQLAHLLDELGTGLSVLGQAVDVITYGFKELGRAGEALFNWIDQKLASVGIGTGSHPLSNAVHTVGDAIKWAWTDLVGEARQDGAPIGALTGDTGRVALTPDARKRLAGEGGTTAPAPIKLTGSVHDQANQLMSQLVSNYGATPEQAAAIAASAFRESSFGANQEGPGGHKGLMQWDANRQAAFKRTYGIDIDQATRAQQIQFMMTDPYERSKMNQAFAGGGDAATLGANFSHIFEGVGNAAEDRTRGALAAHFFAGSPFASTDPSLSPGESIVHINGPVTVQANNPQELVDGIRRQSGVQSYNSAVR